MERLTGVLPLRHVTERNIWRFYSELYSIFEFLLIMFFNGTGSTARQQRPVWLYPFGLNEFLNSSVATHFSKKKSIEKSILKSISRKKSIKKSTFSGQKHFGSRLRCSH